MESIVSVQQEDVVGRILRLAEVEYSITPHIMRYRIFKFVESDGKLLLNF